MEDLKIGLAFSGGGYRAATFDLGTLSFLNTVKLDDGRSLLECVIALSSVSGGTITALKYMLACAQGKTVGGMVKELYDFLCNEDLVTRALQRLSDLRADRNLSSIKIMAGIYDSCLFDHAVMGDIIDNFDKIPVKDYTALATDFDNSLPFRFRLTEGRMTNGSRLTYGVFGNQKHSIKRSVVSGITLGEALACSSCFPSGFEPMIYPDDFKVPQQEDITQRFGIMDGGVVDNQGIDPILLAEERMRKYRDDKSRTDKALDLVIVSDVASPYMDGYTPSEQMLPKSVGKLTIGRLRNYGLIAQALITCLFILAIVLGNGFWIGVMSVLLAIITMINVVGSLLKGKMFSAIAKTFVGNRASFISHLKFATVEAMLMNRAKSIVMMSSQVFLKRLRQMGYDTLYSDKAWENRVVTTTIYELRDGERWQSMAKNETLPPYLIPSTIMQENSAKAAAMGTTLWFTEKDMQKGIPQALMAAGQYTMCYNLLDYIEKIEKSTVNLNDSHQLILACKPQLLESWRRFQEDPQWLLKSLLG